MELAVAYEDEASVVGNLSPFVKVEGEGVGALDAFEARREFGREHCECAVGSVDVEPEAFALTEIGKRSEVVDGAGVDCACAAYDEERREAGAAVVVDGLLEGFDVDAIAAVGCDGAQGVAAEAGEVHRFGDAAVNCG